MKLLKEPNIGNQQYATPTKAGQFVPFIAYLQIIGIVLVVFGHSFHECPDSGHGSNLLVYRMMITFRMPLFMFVSGFLMVFTTFLRSKAIPWRKFAYGKFKRLIIPFLVLSAVTFVPRSILSGIADDPLELSLSSFGESLAMCNKLVIPFFWFLQASFTLLVVCYLWLTLANKLKLKDWIAYLALVVAFAFVQQYCWYPLEWFSLRKTLQFGLFFVLGAVYARWQTRVDTIVPWQSIWFFIISAAAWCALFFITEGTDYWAFCSLAGIAMCVSLAKLLVKYNLHFLNHLVGANYIIFLLSWYFNILSQQILAHFVVLPWWIYTILSLLCGIYLPWLFYRWMAKRPDHPLTNISRHLLGQSFRRAGIK